MSDLKNKKCIPCSGEIPAFSKEEISEHIEKIKGWSAKQTDEGFYFLNKEFKFANFANSLRFINKVSEIAENENHHPDLEFGWGYARITIFTHAINGLAGSDFILAAKIDEISV
jgi:4a-hydroxytetrahydrobiopterin dehydratase